MKKYGPITPDSPFFNKERHERNLKEAEGKHSAMERMVLFWDEPIRSRIDEIWETEDIDITSLFTVST